MASQHLAQSHPPQHLSQSHLSQSFLHTPLGQAQTSRPNGLPPTHARPVLSKDGSPQPEMSDGVQSLAAPSRFGLTGLLNVIRMTDPDLNTLALGTDLTTLGLNLNSTDVLHATFAYPCMDTPTKREPDYVLPYCYYMSPPALKTSHLTKFNLESLFYIFYNMPKDALQIFAAKELYARDWRYHKDTKLWFTRVDGSHPDRPRGYEYFDINAWDRKFFDEVQSLQVPGGLQFMTQEELEPYDPIQRNGTLN